MSDVAPLRERGTWQGLCIQPLVVNLAVPADRLAYNIGVGNMVFATGQAVGAPLGGYLADTIGWRWYVANLLQGR